MFYEFIAKYVLFLFIHLLNRCSPCFELCITNVLTFKRFNIFSLVILRRVSLFQQMMTYNRGADMTGFLTGVRMLLHFFLFWLFVSTSAINCLERLVPEMTYYVSSGTIKLYSLTLPTTCLSYVAKLLLDLLLAIYDVLLTHVAYGVCCYHHCWLLFCRLLLLGVKSCTILAVTLYASHWNEMNTALFDETLHSFTGFALSTAGIWWNFDCFWTAWFSSVLLFVTESASSRLLQLGGNWAGLWQRLIWCLHHCCVFQAFDGKFVFYIAVIVASVLCAVVGDLSLYCRACLRPGR